MKRFILLFVFCLITIVGKAQLVPYRLAEACSDNQGEVTFRLYIFCDSKKQIDHASQLAAIRCVLFEGIPGTKFNKALINEGEATTVSNHQAYFNDLYEWRYADYIQDFSMLSKFKRSGVGKSTLYEVTVKAIELRKDLENNNIKTRFGI
ncbi:MAG: hypothetical protein II963_07280 [Bacteroidales bacterium]|nr:hypothetical protein [Bacteroidales bacterium]